MTSVRFEVENLKPPPKSRRLLRYKHQPNFIAHQDGLRYSLHFVTQNCKSNSVFPKPFFVNENLNRIVLND